MLIDFNAIEEECMPHFKGGEKETFAKMYYDGINRIMKGRLMPGASIGMHVHDTSSEVIFITKGCGTVIFDDGEIAVSAGDCHYCAKGHRHSLINTSAAVLEFTAVVPQQ